ncbi:MULTISPECIES: hypothetical protein [unclassified Microbacterium]|uniref:hypothetical protein n=1 Tax=unclassified Microbacterium TaxID=2609290 RepID=UPI00214B9FDB|nr:MULTISPECIES: hypothetical protein [unclassified Microbacterium]MCR2784901.1 hypothetical protein [Microbacterium sp. zg.B96]WIM16440.1 hypothetical protein QNO11_02040 [Microbacterium sp. zg-B96]
MPEREGVQPAAALAFALIGYIALAICGLGVTSLVSGREVIDAPGAGQVPGIAGMALSVIAVAVVLWVMLRAPRPSYSAALVAALAAFLGYLAGLCVGVVIAGVDVGLLGGAVSSFVLSWFSVVLAVAGAVAGWSAVALVRTRSQRPRWPWESDEDE